MKKFQKSLIFCFTIVFLLELNAVPHKKSGRDLWQQPNFVLDTIGVKQGMTIGEVGAGTGYFTFKLAHRVGSYGMIYANDIKESVLREIESTCKKDSINNVKTILGTITDPKFQKEALDMVFMSYVFHMLQKPIEFTTSLRSYMKSGSTLAIIDFDPKKSWKAPYLKNKDIIKIVTNAGFKLIRVVALPQTKEKKMHHNIYLFRLKD